MAPITDARLMTGEPGSQPSRLDVDLEGRGHQHRQAEVWPVWLNVTITCMSVFVTSSSIGVPQQHAVRSRTRPLTAARLTV